MHVHYFSITVFKHKWTLLANPTWQITVLPDNRLSSHLQRECQINRLLQVPQSAGQARCEKSIYEKVRTQDKQWHLHSILTLNTSTIHYVQFIICFTVCVLLYIYILYSILYIYYTILYIYILYFINIYAILCINILYYT